MTAVVILNFVLAVFVVGGIVALLGRAILADNSGTRLPRRRPATARRQRPARSALDFGA